MVYTTEGFKNYMSVQKNISNGVKQKNLRTEEHKNNFLIVVLPGGMVKDQKTGKWRTVDFNEGDNFGITGDRVRVVAASFLHKDDPESVVLTMGGKGQHNDVADAPKLCDMLKGELIELGVLAAKILIEDKSGSTYENLLELKKILRKNDFKQVKIVSNDWHMPRVRAMIEHRSELKEMEQMVKFEFISAEEVVVEKDPETWRYKVDRAYKTDNMQKRIALELKGVSDLREGKYQL